MEESKKSNNKLIIIGLLVLLLVAIAYTIYSNGEHKKLTDAIQEEKTEIEGNLDSMIAKYEDAIGQNTAISKELELEKEKIVALRDSIKGLEATNYSLMRKYKKQIAQLEESNKRLFKIADSLTNANQLLAIDLDSANVTISNQLEVNENLSKANEELSEKVAIGSVLKVNKAVVLAMRERNNGKLVETQRSRNTDAFRINFTIAKNEISEKGDRQVYVQISDANGNVVAKRGDVEFNGAKIGYSDQTIVNYMNQEVDVISLVEVSRDVIKEGKYTVTIFIDNKIAGATSINLK